MIIRRIFQENGKGLGQKSKMASGHVRFRTYLLVVVALFAVAWWLKDILKSECP